MNKFLFKSLSGLASFSFISLWAGPSLDERIDRLEKEMKDVHVQNVAGTSGAGFAKELGTTSGTNWMINFDILLWHAKSGGTDWVLVTDSAVYPFTGYMKDCGYDWDWGFRVGIGKTFCHDGWDLDLEYTRFHTADSSKVSADFTTPPGTDAAEGNAGPSGSSNGSFTSHINYDNIDLILGKAYFTSSRLALHPYLGIKTSWINQKERLYTTNYINALETFLPSSGNVDTNLTSTCNFWGIGPKVGSNLSWYFSRKFKFLGLIEGALLQGYFKTSQNQWIGVTPTNSAQTTTTIDLDANTRRYIPTARMMLGLGYGTCVRNKKDYFEISLNYEVNYFWRVNQFINESDSDPANISISDKEPVRFNISRLSEDLSFYGVTLELKYMF